MFGVWDSVFCLGAKNAMTTSTLLVMLTIASSNNIFVLKLQNLLDSSSRFKFGIFGKAVILFPSNVLLPMLGVVSVRLVPIEQGIETKRFLNMIEAHPSYSDLANITDIYVGAWEPIYPPYVNFSGITMLAGVIALFILEIVVKTHVSIHGCYFILDNGSLHLSKKTKEMQKKFFRVLWLQVSNTLFSIGFPAIYSLIIILIQPNFIVQWLNNLFFAIAYCHGIIGSITILLLTHPYRLYVLSLIKKTRINGFLKKRLFNPPNKILISVTQ
ncbi:unnamed protein product, partial [Mesorhabditis belari]|uniref:Serpentine Receptor, class H n=1 Tax=Mesorhabditis belari TaxID=2138241 RepID=A0AAF3EMI7_9BILA